jgi:hypothetical protein
LPRGIAAAFERLGGTENLLAEPTADSGSRSFITSHFGKLSEDYNVSIESGAN